MGNLLALYVISVVGAWPLNFYSLTQCDFRPDYKCEAIHGIGLVPILSPITVWYGDDSDINE